jgi:hypothetical protein
VIKEPRGRGGHSPRWAAEPEKIFKIIFGVIARFKGLKKGELAGPRWIEGLLRIV